MGFVGRIYYSAIFLQFLLVLCFIVADSVRVPSAPVCPVKSIEDFIFATDEDMCALVRPPIYHTTDVIEGDEATLAKASHFIQKNENEYIALLFYSSWCPFSEVFRSSFLLMSSIFPTVPHFAIEESAVRPSILSKYGVHGFPSLILRNSTMRMRYQGSRTVDSVISFYEEFTGIKTTPADEMSLDQHSCPRHDARDRTYSEACPFPWARSPGNMFQQETYLTLATTFVILRLAYLAFPTLQRCFQLAWRRYVRSARLSNLWQHVIVCLNHAIQLFKSLKEPCKKSNLQGARNAQAWASKSLATVSFGDGSSSHNEQ